MIGLVLLLQCGCATELQQRRVRIRAWCFISEGRVAVKRTGTVKNKARRDEEGGLQHCHTRLKHHTYFKQQWVFANPLNGSYQVTFKWDVCVFPASQQHAVLKMPKGGSTLEQTVRLQH